MREFLFKIPVPISLDYLRKKSHVNPLVLNYHVVSDKNLPHISAIYPYRSSTMFAEDMKFLSDQFHIVSLPELLDHVNNHVPLPEKSLHITFDDGLKEVFEVAAPILIDRKIFPTVFLTKDFIDNKLLGYDHRKSLIINHLASIHDQSPLRKIGHLLGINETTQIILRKHIISVPYKKRHVIDEIAQIVHLDFDKFLHDEVPYLSLSQVLQLRNEGFHFGGHSIDHPNFLELTLDEQVRQARESIDYVCSNLGINYRVFAFPYWDAGISKEFFTRLLADATFGTQGLANDMVTSNIQRISVEKSGQSAKRVLKSNYIRKIIYQKLKKDLIVRF